MKRVCLFLILAMTACLAMGTVLTYTDDFNDGVRDKTFWRVDNTPGGGFVEMNGHLYGYSGPDFHPSGYYGINWKMKAVQLVVKGDFLEVESKFHFPKQTFPFLTVQAMEIGWMSTTNEHMLAKAYMYNGSYGRVIALIVQNTNIESDGEAVSLPVGTTFWLKLRYNAETGKVGLWWRQTAADAWTLATTAKMNANWAVPVGKLLFLTPYVRFLTRDNRLDSPGPYFIDNFTTRLIAP